MATTSGLRLGLAGVGRIGSFHAETLLAMESVDELVITDPNSAAASALAERLGARVVADVDELLEQVDGFVIAAASSVHADLLRAAMAAGVPTFCEKPVATDLTETITLAEIERTAAAPVQIGFQRRFDAGFTAAREAVATGDLGFLHTLRANTFDQSPPPAEYIPTSGGIFRDCSIHDLDIIRWITGQEFVSARAAGANQGASFFSEAGDVDTGSALLTMTSGTLALVSATRYNGAGYDVRLEVLAEHDSLSVGLDESLPLRSVEPGARQFAGPPVTTFMDRFRPAYIAELQTFTRLVRGEIESPSSIADALESFRAAEACAIALAEDRTVELAEIKR